MRTDLFDFDLPESAIALEPASPRDAARLLVVRPSSPLSPRLRGEDRGEGQGQTPEQRLPLTLTLSPCRKGHGKRGPGSTIALFATSPICSAPATPLFQRHARDRAALQGQRLRGENRAHISFNLHKRVDESRWRASPGRPSVSPGDRIALATRAVSACSAISMRR